MAKVCVVIGCELYTVLAGSSYGRTSEYRAFSWSRIHLHVRSPYRLWQIDERIRQSRQGCRSREPSRLSISSMPASEESKRVRVSLNTQRLDRIRGCVWRETYLPGSRGRSAGWGTTRRTELL